MLKSNIIKSLDEFKIFLEKYKSFKKLSNQYKSTKFIKLYMKIYEYMLSIPKEKIIITSVKRCIISRGLLNYINYFLLAKDFYQWRNRIYSLMTEKISNKNYRKYELLYGSKAKKFFEKYLCKMQKQFKFSCKEIYGVEYPMQSKEIQEKTKATCLERYGKEYYIQTEECKEKILKTLNERYGSNITNVFQVKECKEKSKDTCKKHWNTDHPMRSKNVQEKNKETCLKKYSIPYTFLLAKQNGFHSKIADDMCKSIDELMGTKNSNYTYYATKNGELSLKKEDNNYFFYDYMNTQDMWGVEFQGLYSHGLLESQEYAYGTSVEEIHRKDEEKRLLAESKGFKIFYVYENEYKANKSKCLENLLKEIKNYVHSKENRL